MIQEKFGPHSADWMSLDSNVMKDEFKKVQGQGTYFSTSYVVCQTFMVAFLVIL